MVTEYQTPVCRQQVVMVTERPKHPYGQEVVMVTEDHRTVGCHGNSVVEHL